MRPPAKDTTKLLIRVPPELHRALVARAEANERSLNGEVVHALKRYLGIDETEDERRLREAIARADRREGLVTVSPEDLAAIRREIEALAARGVTGGVSPTLERLRREAGDAQALPESARAG